MREKVLANCLSEVGRPIQFGCRGNLPITWYEADIAADAIVSLAWMSRWNIDVRSREHGVMIKSTRPPIWVKGCSQNGRSRIQTQGAKEVAVIATTPIGPAQPPRGYGKKTTRFRIPHVTEVVDEEREFAGKEEEPESEESQAPKMLNLFSGSGSVGRVFSDMGLEVVSLDRNPTTDPTICMDIMDWDYKAAFHRVRLRLYIAALLIWRSHQVL